MVELRRGVSLPRTQVRLRATVARVASVLLLAILLSLTVACAQEGDSGSSGFGTGRQGPYATQDTAWQRWREAQNQGREVSNGVFPCYEDYTRGYCFNTF